MARCHIHVLQKCFVDVDVVVVIVVLAVLLFCCLYVHLGSNFIQTIGHTSLSRVHCEIYADAALSHEDPHDQGQLHVTDRSTFGTTVEEPSGHREALTKNQRGQLYDGSSIVLGEQSSVKWTMHIRWKPLVFCASRMSSSMRDSMHGMMTRLGAHLVSALSEECTHLMMPQLIATTKVLIGAARGLPIVSPQYIEEAVRRVSESSSLPDPHDFLPPAENDNLKELLGVDPHLRRVLLEGLTFYCFLESQFKRTHEIIKAYGGEILLLRSSRRQTWMKQGKLVVLSPYGAGPSVGPFCERSLSCPLLRG